MPISKQYDDLFARHAGKIPVAYLRALAWYESGLNPRAVHPRGTATGLFQVTKIALDDYNKRNGTRHSLSDLGDPELSTKVATSHIAHVIAAYSAVPSLRTDWQSRRFMDLLTLGWNGGHNAVLKVVRTLEGQGIPADRITVDTVSQLAAKLGLPYLSDPRRVTWAKRVTAASLQPGTPPAVRPSPVVATTPPAPSRGSLLVAATVVGAAIVGAYTLASAGGPRRSPA
jgi:hypothetical protein